MSVSIKAPDENPSNVESILSDTIGLPGYTINPPGSRIEELLIELNELIKSGGDSDAYATNLSLTIDSSTYVITAVLKNKDGESIGTPQTIDLPMESVVVSGSYNSQTKKVVLTLQNGSTVEFSVADLIDGLQTEITSTNKLNADLVDDATSTHKFTTAEDISKLSGIESQANKTIVDSSITDGGTNPVTGGSIYTALAGKQNTIDSSHKVSADLVDDTNATNKFATAAQLSQIETNKTNILLKANTSDVNTATANLQAQINNIITPVTQDAEVENARVNRSGVPHTTLKERIDDDEYEIQKISDAIPHTLDIEQKTINNVGVISDNNTRTLTAVTYVKSGDMLSVETGYSFRYATYTRTGDEFNFSEMDSTWRNSSTFNIAGYKRIVFKKNDDSNLTPDDTVKIISSSSTINIPVKYTIDDDIERLTDDMSELKRDNMNLLIPLTGKDNMMWSYALSLYPLCQHYKRVRNCVYWGYTTHEGYSGIACYNLDDKTLKKTHLKKSDIDDHNPCTIFVRDNGEIIVSYSGGHNTDTYIHIRKSLTPECIDFFDDDRNINVDYYSTYSQIFEYNNKIWIFFRYDNTSWGCITSTDGGATWSTRQAIIFANVQYYCKFQKTTTDGLIRMCMYSNPDQTEKDIRMGFLDLSNGKIYNADNATELGSVGTAVRWENFSVLIPAPDTGKQRLFDVAVTAPNTTSILIARWTTYVDGVYKWYNNGNLVDICNCGAALYTDKYQGGVAFISNTEIVVSRSWDGNDYIEIWDLSATPTKQTEIYNETNGTIPIRNCRPIVSPDGKALLWHRGYYNSTDYTDFNAEAKIYMIDSNTII